MKSEHMPKVVSQWKKTHHEAVQTVKPKNQVLVPFYDVRWIDGYLVIYPYIYKGKPVCLCVPLPNKESDATKFDERN